jgi:hypothetical protein
LLKENTRLKLAARLASDLLPEYLVQLVLNFPYSLLLSQKNLQRHGSKIMELQAVQLALKGIAVFFCFLQVPNVEEAIECPPRSLDLSEAHFRQIEDVGGKTDKGRGTA